MEVAKQNRTAVKGSLTRFITYFDNVKGTLPDSIKINELQIRLNAAEKLLDAFNNSQSQIESVDSDYQKNIDTIHRTERENFENKYYSIIAQVNQFICDFNGSQTNQASQSNASSSNQGQLTNFKLPSLNLPVFDGEYDQWLFFRDTFSSIIDKNLSLTKIQKFHYLRLSLKGKAAETIRSLEISSNNYDVAWKLITDRFENKQILINNHIKHIFNLPHLDRESNQGLRQLLDGLQKHLGALRVLELPVDDWDAILIYLISTKLDNGSRREWELSNKTETLPTLTNFIDFLKDRCRFLETLEATKENHNKSFHNKPTLHSSNKNAKSFLVSSKQNCAFCKHEHLIYTCPDFLKLEPSSRLNEAKHLRLCINCLRSGHLTKDCRSSGCRKCHKVHHTLLHFPNPQRVNLINEPTTHTEPPNNQNDSEITQVHTVQNILDEIVLTSNNGFTKPLVLLSTAIVKISDKHGKWHDCKVLLDSGSQSNFISENLCKILDLPLNKIDFSISGINQVTSNINYRTSIKIQSNYNDYKTTISCLVLTNIGGVIPSFTFNQNLLTLPDNITLADPKFNESSPIDLLIGAEIFWEIVSIGQIKLGKDHPILQKTKLGWVISGPLHFKQFKSNTICNFSIDDSLDHQLQRFWEIENFPNKPFLSEEDNFCEKHFKENTCIRTDGHFSVSLPLKHSPHVLGDSKTMANKRFLSLENKLLNNTNLLTQYHEFIKEYISLSHMSLVTNTDDNTGFFLPHHCIVKGSSSTTKLRVVFDGSAKTSTDYSLNDIMMVGPTIQEDLFSIVLRFRKYNYVLTADITKMYRQVFLNNEHRQLHKILWRFNPEDDISVYNLNTVTYGTASASFLAIRSLHEIAYMYRDTLPDITSIILHDFYVDDLLTGGDSIEQISHIKEQLSILLEKHGFPLRKWISNCTNIQSKEDYMLTIGRNEPNKTLGLLWNPIQDYLEYSIAPNASFCKTTKRQILSSISQIFDPLGLLSPVTIIAKTILQELWKLKISWDESIPMDLYTKWSTYRKGLDELNNIKFPRHVLCLNPISVQLHAFCDASQIAYGCCIYLRSLDSFGKYHCNILCAKTRVAPLKQLTIPKLELCGAVLLVDLVNKVKESTQLSIDKCYFWCDSTIVLSWINASPSILKTFNANRIAHIQNLTDSDCWHHISTLQNPADLLSRGIIASKLIDSKLWFHGPDWLSLPEAEWPVNLSSFIMPTNELPDVKTIKTFVSTDTDFINNFNKFSRLITLQKCFAWIIRFKTNLRTSRTSRQIGPLTTAEMQESLDLLVFIVQQHTFQQDYLTLSKGETYKGKLLSLHPFVHTDKIIRVGGRIRNSNFNFNKKHPAILPANGHFITLLANYEHLRLLHAGPQLLLSSIRERYWPVSGKNLVKKVVRNCIYCFRFQAKPEKYLMGDLPKERITPSRPFTTCGLDYAGPISIRDRKTKKFQITKAYIALFICFATKAIHLEVVSDLSSECFLAALRRFFSRRGKPVKIFSDNGTTFVGANNALKDFFTNFGETVSHNLTTDGINWSFIPAQSPHFGGLWEAGVKTVKYHLKRVMGNAILTYEELSTILCQIESCVNSRPLYPLSDDPNDTLPLTPAHFLIGDTMTSVPDHNYLEVPMNRLSRFQRCQQILQGFWNKWSKEYISHLQQRVKWKQNFNSILKPGVLVLCKDDNLPPLKWSIGRIIAVHPGKDNIIRAVTLKTSTGTYKRPVIKLCVLPNQE